MVLGLGMDEEHRAPAAPRSRAVGTAPHKQVHVLTHSTDNDLNKQDHAL